MAYFIFNGYAVLVFFFGNTEPFFRQGKKDKNKKTFGE